MGRDFHSVAVVKGYAADGSFVTEDIVSLADFRASESRLLSSAQVRKKSGIRFISLRLFDESGARTEAKSLYYSLEGEPVEGLIRRVDGSIIEDAGRFV
jgi:hypothetical protein